MSYSHLSAAKKSAEKKAISEQLCQTRIHLKLDKTRQLQFIRFLLKGPRINVASVTDCSLKQPRLYTFHQKVVFAKKYSRLIMLTLWGFLYFRLHFGRCWVKSRAQGARVRKMRDFLLCENPSHFRTHFCDRWSV